MQAGQDAISAQVSKISVVLMTTVKVWNAIWIKIKVNRSFHPPFFFIESKGTSLFPKISERRATDQYSSKIFGTKKNKLAHSQIFKI